MLNLISLELKKMNPLKYVKNALISDVIIFLMLNFIIYLSYLENNLEPISYSELFQIMESVVNITFMIFSGVLLSRVIIREYKNKTIEVMFCYPISRKKIIVSKLILVASIIFISVVAANILIGSAFYITGFLDNFIGDKLTIMDLIHQCKRSIFLGFIVSMIGLIPIYFGFRKKSTSATIVSSVIVAVIVTSNSNGFSLYSIIPVSIILSILGGLIAYIYVIKNINDKDVIS